MKPKAFRDIPAGCARAAIGHMPFAGHRTCETWIAQNRPRPQLGKSERELARRAREYGYDPDCVRRQAP